MKEDNTGSILHDLYYNVNSSSAFTGKNAFFKEAKKQIPSLTRKYVDNWLQKQLTYTLHKPVRYNFKRVRTYVKGIDVQWQADLCDMSNIKKENDNNTFLLTCIDCFSKFAWVEVLINKSGIEILAAMKRIMKTRQPKRLQTDKGTEFLNYRVQNMLKERGIEFFTTNSELKASIVERFNRTLKSRMYKYFTANNTLRYVDVVQQLVEGYNASYQGSIGMKPINVRSVHEHEIRKRLYPKNTVQKKYKYNVGDVVRISKTRRTFKKGYLPSWTEETFRVFDRKKYSNTSAYYLQDFNKELLKGLFYEEELQKVQEQDLYRIEKVIRSKLVKGKKLYLVKWKGWSDAFNSWVEELQDL